MVSKRSGTVRLFIGTTTMEIMRFTPYLAVVLIYNRNCMELFLRNVLFTVKILKMAILKISISLTPVLAVAADMIKIITNFIDDGKEYPAVVCLLDWM
jgi:hypothetical protein